MAFEPLGAHPHDPQIPEISTDHGHFGVKTAEWGVGVLDVFNAVKTALEDHFLPASSPGAAARISEVFVLGVPPPWAELPFLGLKDGTADFGGRYDQEDAQIEIHIFTKAITEPPGEGIIDPQKGLLAIIRQIKDLLDDNTLNGLVQYLLVERKAGSEYVMLEGEPAQTCILTARYTVIS